MREDYEDFDSDESKSESDYIYRDGVRLRVISPETLDRIPEDLPEWEEEKKRLGMFIDIPRDSNHEEHWFKKVNLESDSEAVKLQAENPWIRTQDDLEEACAQEECVRKNVGLFKLRVENGTLISDQEPRNEFLYGHWSQDPTPDYELEVERRRRYRGENLIVGFTQQGERHRAFVGSGNDEDEVPWNDDTPVDPWGENTKEFDGDEVETTRGVYEPSGPKVALWAVFDHEGHEVLFWPLLRTKQLEPEEIMAKAAAILLSHTTGNKHWEQQILVPKIALSSIQNLSKGQLQRSRPIRRVKIKVRIHNTVVTEATRWWSVLDREGHVIPHMSGSHRSGTRGFNALSYNWVEGRWNDEKLRNSFLNHNKYLVDTCKIDIRTVYRTDWNKEVVSCTTNIPEEWVEELGDLGNAPIPTKFCFDVLGPAVLIRELKAKWLHNLCEMNKAAELKAAQALSSALRKKAKRRRILLLAEVLLRHHKDTEALKLLKKIKDKKKPTVCKGDSSIFTGFVVDAKKIYFCEKCGKKISRSRVELAASLHYQWGVFASNSSSPLAVFSYFAKARADHEVMKLSAREEKALRISIRERRIFTKRTFKAALFRSDSCGIHPGHPGSYLLNRCVVVTPSRRATTRKFGKQFVFQPAQKQTIKFCDGTDLEMYSKS